jgi:hypothetical protein
MDLKTIDIRNIKFRPYSIADPDAINNIKLEHFVRQYGQIKPLVVAFIKDGDEYYYEVIDGNRVLRCLQRLGIKLAYCIVYNELTIEERVLYAINLNLFHVFHDEVSVSDQIKLLVEKYGRTKVPYMTPFSQEEITNYIDLSDFDWEKYKSEVPSSQMDLFNE